MKFLVAVLAGMLISEIAVNRCGARMEIKFQAAVLTGMIISEIATIPKMGPYDIIVKQMADCNEKGTDEFKLVGNKIRRHNRTAAIYSGTLVIPREVNNNYKLSPVVAFFGNGGWKSVTHGFDVGGVCMLLTNFAPAILKTALARTGVPPPYCPIPPGNYTISNMSMQVELKMPAIPYNAYRVDFQFFYKDGKKVGCKRIFVDSVPKKDHHG